MMESSKLRLHGWENNGTSSNNRTPLLDPDNVAVSDFVISLNRKQEVFFIRKKSPLRNFLQKI